MLQCTYKVEFETDPDTKQVTAKLPALNHTADFGETAEEALANLRELANGLIEVLLDEGKEIPPNDKTVIQPGGSINDEAVIAAANEHGIAMIFTGMRHFRH